VSWRERWLRTGSKEREPTPVDVPWLDGERVEEATMATRREPKNGCIGCGKPPKPGDGPDGSIVVTYFICASCVGTIAKKKVEKKLPELFRDWLDE